MATLTPSLVLSVFSDEISSDFGEQLATLRALGVNYIELRSAWDKNVVDFDDGELKEIGRLLDDHGIRVACIGSPVGKSPIERPLEFERGRLARVLDVAAALDTGLVRMFSFFAPDGTPRERLDEYVPESAERLAELAKQAEERGVCLVLENEGPLIGNTPQRCRALLDAVASPALRLAWDSANFLLTGVAEPAGQGWPLLAEYVRHVHIKDALVPGAAGQAHDQTEENPMVLPGAGVAQIPELLARLWESGYQGYLALEPHLKVAGRFGGFSGPEGTAEAIAALRHLMAGRGYAESPHLPQASAG